MAEKKPASAEVSAGKEKLNSEELEKKIEELEKQKDEYLTGWQRARADLLNYKKEEMERIGELVGYTTEELILKILPILDNFEVTEKNLPEDLKKDDNIKGLLQIKKQIQDFLKSQGVEEIKSIGEKFDPNFHEAVEDVPSDLSAEAQRAKAEASAKEGVEVKEAGTIIEEIQKGYKINGRLLRAGKVRIVK